MKKSNLILLFILLVALTTSTCKKKNYPKDIPKWLKEKIDKMEKEAKEVPVLRRFSEKYSRGCKDDICRTVEEYNDGSSTYYWISLGSKFGSDIYNYNGEMVCYSILFTSPCGNSGYSKYYVRLVWRES